MQQVLFLAVPNMQAPSVEQAQRFLEAVSRRGEGQDNAVVVHCGGGKGRAGTLLALAMMARRMGQGWKGVIDKLREMRSEASNVHVIYISSKIGSSAWRKRARTSPSLSQFGRLVSNTNFLELV
jgi:protein-tyrosine phosphatase